MTFAKTQLEEKVKSCGESIGGVVYEENPRLHTGFELIGGDRNTGFGKRITTEATHGIR
jgi:hypothetical protein